MNEILSKILSLLFRNVFIVLHFYYNQQFINFCVGDLSVLNVENYFKRVNRKSDCLQEKQSNHVPRLKEKVDTPEGVPRLFDLIKVQEEKMKLAFFAALGNTIVAKDIDQVFLFVKIDTYC